jgi:hypothetical protein
MNRHPGVNPEFPGLQAPKNLLSNVKKIRHLSGAAPQKTPFKSSAYPVRVPILKNRNAMRKGLEVSHCSTAHSTGSDY